ncbi:MAG: hypothetical protein ACSLE1_13060 [Sphingobium sp.]
MHFLLSAIDDLNEIFGLLTVLGVCGVAILLGSRQQKLAGVVQLIDAFGIALFTAFVAREDRMIVGDLKSLIILACYCGLTIRWPDTFLILLTGLQGYAVSLHLAVWIDRSIQSPVNALLLNITGWLMLLVLVASVSFRWFTAAKRTAIQL